jgi:hypothetical protein
VSVEPSPEARSLWAATRVRVWPERYWLVSLPTDAVAHVAEWFAGVAGSFGGIVADWDELSLTLPENIWLGSPLRARARSASGPFRAISFDVELPFEITGYLAPVAARLASAGVSIVPQCGYSRDHVLVREEQLETAVSTIRALVEESAGAPPADPAG